MWADVNHVYRTGTPERVVHVVAALWCGVLKNTKRSMGDFLEVPMSDRFLLWFVLSNGLDMRVEKTNKKNNFMEIGADVAFAKSSSLCNTARRMYTSERHTRERTRIARPRWRLLRRTTTMPSRCSRRASIQGGVLQICDSISFHRLPPVMFHRWLTG